MKQVYNTNFLSNLIDKKFKGDDFFLNTGFAWSGATCGGTFEQNCKRRANGQSPGIFELQELGQNRSRWDGKSQGNGHHE